MKYLILTIFLFSCAKPGPLQVCMEHCKYHLYTNVKHGNTSNIYRCSCNN